MFEEVFKGTNNLGTAEDGCICICSCTGEIRFEIKLDELVFVLEL